MCCCHLCIHTKSQCHWLDLACFTQWCCSVVYEDLRDATSTPCNRNSVPCVHSPAAPCDRGRHAQTTTCPVVLPRLSLAQPSSSPSTTDLHARRQRSRHLGNHIITTATTTIKTKTSNNNKNNNKNNRGSSSSSSSSSIKQTNKILNEQQQTKQNNNNK